MIGKAMDTVVSVMAIQGLYMTPVSLPVTASAIAPAIKEPTVIKMARRASSFPFETASAPRFLLTKSAIVSGASLTLTMSKATGSDGA